jgi:pentafunctional AROM polypeptide
MGVEFLDLEIQFPEPLLRTVSEGKGQTIVIASHHDPVGALSWSDGSWVYHYNKALLYGDVIKLVGVAHTQQDNAELLQFKSWATSAHDIPVIAINMGREGQLSRIQNSFLTPVSHPALPFKAAPGQLFAAEIRLALSLHGEIKPCKFYLFGKPIGQSRSPAMHNALFKSVGLPHTYGIFETERASDLEQVLRSEDFGGASVTIPLKIDTMPYLDEVADDARIIGAVNTIIPDPSRISAKHQGQYLTGKNTDWQGMRLVLQNAGALAGNGTHSGLVVGAGGTARAAIYALHQMGFSPIYVLGRSPEKLQSLIKSFPDEYNLKSLDSANDARNLLSLPIIIIGTIPADKPIDPSMKETLQHFFRHRTSHVPSAEDDRERKEEEELPRILLEMAYKPATTPLMEMAAAEGWTTIPGSEVLVGQGIYQFEHWTGISPLLEEARVGFPFLGFVIGLHVVG